MNKKALVCGAGGFIGSHLVKRLKKEGFWVRGVDIKDVEFGKTEADEFIIGDLRDPLFCRKVIDISFDELYQLAADMGGAGFVFTGDNDADIMHNSCLINLNVLEASYYADVERIFYSGSACMYPEYNQMDPENPKCSEDSAYPAAPDSEYGWEKLFSERLYLSFAKNYNLDVHIARYHNIFGPEGTWKDGREKAPAALCRKVIMAEDNTYIEVWGDGKQTRSFLYIDDCIEGTLRLTRSNFAGPVNIGSEEMVTINQLAEVAIDISNKNLSIHNIFGKEFEDKYGFPTPLGVKGRNSDNKLMRKELGWEPRGKLRDGMEKTYAWIKKQVDNMIETVEIPDISLKASKQRNRKIT